MKTVIQSLQNFYRKGNEVTLFIQGSFFHFSDVVVSQSGVLAKDGSGHTWFFDPDSIAGYSLDYDPAVSPLPVLQPPADSPKPDSYRDRDLERHRFRAEDLKGHKEAAPLCQDESGQSGNTQYQRLADFAAGTVMTGEPLTREENDFLINLYPSDDAKLLEQCITKLEMPAFASSRLLWPALRESMGKASAAAQKEAESLMLQIDTLCKEDLDKCLNQIEEARLQYPQFEKIFVCLRAKAFLAAGEKEEAIALFLEQDYYPEAISLIEMPRFRSELLCLLAYYMLQTADSYLSNTQQKLVLLYAAYCGIPEEAAVFHELVLRKCEDGDADPAYTAAVIFLIRKKICDFEPDPEDMENILPLLAKLKETWGFTESGPIERGRNVRDAMIGRKAPCDGRVKAFAEPYGRLSEEKYYMVQLKYRLKNSSKKQVPYQFWLHFLPEPDSKDELYLNAHQIIDPFLSRYLTTMPEDRITSASCGIVFFSGCNDKGVTANFAFLSGMWRKTALHEAVRFPQFRQTVDVCLDPFKLLPAAPDSLLINRFGEENCKNRLLANQEEAMRDARVFLFLRQALDDFAGDVVIPDAFEEDPFLKKCAAGMIRKEGRAMTVRMLCLCRLIWRLRQQDEALSLLVESFCYGLPDTHPFFISQEAGDDKNKDYLWDQILKALRELKLIEVLCRIPAWKNALLKKKKKTSPEGLEPSHKAQWDRVELLAGFIKDVLEGEKAKAVEEFGPLCEAEGIWKSEKAALEIIREACALYEKETGCEING